MAWAKRRSAIGSPEVRRSMGGRMASGEQARTRMANGEWRIPYPAASPPPSPWPGRDFAAEIPPHPLVGRVNQIAPVVQDPFPDEGRWRGNEDAGEAEGRAGTAIRYSPLATRHSLFAFFALAGRRTRRSLSGTL